MYTACLDRIVDGVDAVLLLEEDEKTVDKLILDVDQLPPDGQHRGALLEVVIDDGELVDATHLPGKEQERHERIKKKARKTNTISIEEFDPGEHVGRRPSPSSVS